jgi:hypothetical protein
MEARTRLFGETCTERRGVNTGTLTPPATFPRQGDDIAMMGRSA